MSLFKAFFIFFLGLALSTLGCAPRISATPTPSRSPLNPPFKAPPRRELPRPKADDAKLQTTVTKLNEFSLNLYTDLANSQDGNLVVSPIGGFLLLELLYEGSAGETRDGLASVLGRSQSGMPEVARLVWDLNALPSLHIAQKIFVASQAQFVDGYLEKISPVLGEPLKVVPFADEPASAVGEINDWVSEQTGGLIQRAIQTVSPDTVCALVSTLHFHGQWQHQFPGSATESAKFHLDEGGEIDVPLMRLEEVHLNYFRMEKAQGVVLPYTDETELVLLLPDKDYGTDDLWTHVNPKIELGKYPGHLRYVTVELPRFEFRPQTLGLNESLQRIGLAKVLKDADLTSMLTLKPPAPLELDFYHQAYIKVDEKGTEAAAVTALMVSATPAASMRTPEYVTIRFDRPFGFLLRHSRTGAVLLLGRVEEPEIWGR